MILTEEGDTEKFEVIYELEDIRHDYGPQAYNRVMAEIHDQNYGKARKILYQLEER